MPRYISALLLLITATYPLSAPLSAQELTSETLHGLEFRNIGPAAMSGRVVDLAVLEKDPYTFYVASATGGLWKTINNGVTFEVVFKNEGTHSIGDVVVHQKADSLVWVGTGERANRQSSSWGDGVYKSMDSGTTWTNMGLRDSHHIGRIVMHPDDPNTVYVAAMGHLWGPNDERGLYKTTDGGKTWNRVLGIDEHTGIVDVAMDPDDPNILYAAAYQRRRRPYGFHGGGPGSGLYKTTDGGATWQELTSGLPAGDKGRMGISIYRSDPNIVYISLEQGYRYNASTAYNERRAGLYRSEDKGETWTYTGNWNPRPMYASQPLVDPNDDQRIYMMNRYSYSEDGGKTFRAPRQSLHGDDRILWVNPEDSRHVIKGDDGGVGISYDRGITWLYVTSLPVSQFYRVSVDMRKPYWVYGGLQDNGSWAGPGATYLSDGILNNEWMRTGGGDGFVNLPHREDENTLYVESQYLGLSRFDLNTRQRRAIRPGDSKGRIGPRRNWDAWGPGTPEPELGNAMAPGNWDGPFILSHHDPNTIYAGTNILWKSTDGGDAWTALGDLTTGVNRRNLPIMGMAPHDTTLSLDDGIPYYPTLTAVAESPMDPSLLYAGSDDGNFQVSRDGGQTWIEASARMPGLPRSTWINGIEASRYEEGTVYVAINNYRNDDFTNYVYRSADYGATWQAITNGLPDRRVARTIREDPKNSDLLYLGTELGLFISLDRGDRWVELRNNLPLAAINDLVVHPRDNDLVLGTHGRGIWILDNLSALQELTPEVLAADAHLAGIPDAEMIRYTRAHAHAGDMIFRGKNPAAGALIDYYLKEPAAKDAVQLAIHDAAGTLIRELAPDSTAGINRMVWDLRYPRLPAAPVDTLHIDHTLIRTRNTSPEGPSGPWVTPGLYVARLTVNGRTHSRTFTVDEDPRINLPVEQRRRWTDTLLEIADLYTLLAADNMGIQPVIWQIEKYRKENKKLDEKAATEIEETGRLYSELFSRVRSLYSHVSGWPGPLTTDQQSQWAYYQDMYESFISLKEDFNKKHLPRLNKKLAKEDRIATGL
ncbi:MAG: hypothetical protein VX603_11055 [Gemmatimonadota bacterium]|nr:hypothetical protein [Gemmatimonadota bacterium]